MYKRVLSIVLTLVMLFSMVAGDVAFAKGSSTDAKQIFQEMTPEARAVLLKYIESNSPTLLTYHKKYIDTSYVSNIDSPLGSQGKSISTSAASMNPALPILEKRLISIGLSTATRYAFMGVGASIVAACADGPFPVGDAIAVIIDVIAVPVIIANWKEVGPNWDSIVSAFKDAFSSMGSAATKKIDEAFYKTSVAVSGMLYKYKISGDKLTISGFAALTLTRDTSKKPLYYFAVRSKSGGVTKKFPINYSDAKAVMRLGKAGYPEGVFCVMGDSSAYTLAKNVCSPAKFHSGNSWEAPHYHPNNYKTHAWYSWGN